jgi:O-antigen ligase
MEEGSAYDRFALNMLLLLSLWVLSRRKINWSLLLKNNIWLILLSVYLGLSILWSDFMFVSFKRWIKIAGTVIMACVILTETQPLKAIESMLRRCAYVLVPLSLVLIKYFPFYGILYTRQGVRTATGVATQKNGLGVLCALSAFMLIWAIIRDKRSGELFKNLFHTIADVLVIGIALFLLFGGGSASSATSVLVFYVGIAFLLGLRIWKNLTEHVANHLKIFMVVGIVLFMLFNHFLSPMINSLLSRDETLTGRTDIWRSVLEVAALKPILGTGYGGYWGLHDEFDRHY